MTELRVRSSIKDYSVIFVDDFSKHLAGDWLTNSFFLIDKRVSEVYRQKLENVLQWRHLIVEATEPHKTLEYAKFVVKFLLNNNARRNSKLIAIGGGVIQDITGFVASILFRGVEWLFYPTTLLAQCDSCIGSKTSINVDEFKNQLGTFYPPRCVVLDVNFIKTLSPSDIKSGMGEIIKVHLLDGAESLEYISSHYSESPSGPLLKELIVRSLTIKKSIIEKDEFDRDYRNILQYGHSFGHAIESATEYKICHGQAVTLGMDIVNYISLELGILPQKWYKLMTSVIARNYPNIHLDHEQVELVMAALAKDKKNVDQDITLILTKGPGEMLKMRLPQQNLKQYLNNYVSIRCTM